MNSKAPSSRRPGDCSRAVTLDYDDAEGTCQPSPGHRSIEGTRPANITRSKSSNLYRQHGTLATSLTRSVSQETEISSSGARKNTPTRAVFHDLTTAHFSITSGSARRKSKIQGRDVSQNLPDIGGDEDSIPLEDLGSLNPNSLAQDVLFQNLPLPPDPAVISRIRPGNFLESTLLTDDEESTKIQRPTPPVFPGNRQIPVFANPKNALVPLSSSLSNSADLDQPTQLQWPRKETDSLTIKTTNPAWTHEAAPVRTFSGSPSSIYYSHAGIGASSSAIPSSRHFSNLASYQNVVQLPNLSSTPLGKNISLVTPRQLSTFGVLPSDASIAHEGSTIGNILRHYAGSSSGGDDTDGDLGLQSPTPNPRTRFSNQGSEQGMSSSSTSSNQFKPSALNVRKQRRANGLRAKPIPGQPPFLTLPAVPQNLPQHVAPSASQGIVPSSSYGDTRNLLEITQRSHFTEKKPILIHFDGRTDLRSDQTVARLTKLPEPSLSNLNSNNPYLVKDGLRAIALQAGDGECLYMNDQETHRVSTEKPPQRNPLEREVSKALRRASGLSFYSNGSVSSSVFQYADYPRNRSASQAVALIRRMNNEDTPPSGSGSVDGETSLVAAQAQAFYDEGAIPQHWVTTRAHNVVRVPISHGGGLPDSPPQSPPEPNVVPFGYRNGSPNDVEEDNDWETVGESAFGFEKNNKEARGLFGGTINLAGSSLANTSDDGTASMHIPEVDDFSSTDRIAQHPGNIDYSGNYSRRNLKKTHIPIMLPKYTEHKVNGFLADSTRILPRPCLFRYRPQPPLPYSHKNPFRSSPPEALDSPQVKHGQRNHFPSFRKEPLSAEERDLGQMGTESLSSKLTPISSFEHERWMDDGWGDPGPAIRYNTDGKRQLLDPINHHDRPSQSSWQFVEILGKGDRIEGYNADGTPIRDTSPSGDIGLGGSRFEPGSKNAGIFERLPAGSYREHRPLVEGPPGAFYQGLARSKQDRKHSRASENANKCLARGKILLHNRNRRDYPTNSLRPFLSTLPNSRPVTPELMKPRDDNGPRDSNEFVYRSPLAPPKEWKAMYCKNELTYHKERAKADGFVDISVSSTASLAPRGGQGSSRKYLSVRPRLFSCSERPQKQTSSSERPPGRTVSSESQCDDESFTTAQLAAAELAHRHKYSGRKISAVVLVLCSLVPPFLLLYWAGRLDGIIFWWTDGELLAFGKEQKKWALRMMYAWGMMVLVALGIGFGFYFTHLHQGS